MSEPIDFDKLQQRNAEKLLETAFINKVGLSYMDLEDSMIIGQSIEEIRECLEANDIDCAKEIAKYAVEEWIEEHEYYFD